jgi:hypothetical protein
MSFWVSGAMAAAAVVSSAVSAQSSANAASKLSVAGNEAVIKSNIRNTIRTGYRVGLLNMQRGLQKRETVQAGYDITKQGAQALGQVNANVAAAGAVGASADAVAMDIKMKMGEARASLENKNEINAGNFNTSLENITYEGEMSLQEGRKADIQSGSEIMRGALVAGAMSFASSYAGSKMGAGTGNKPPSSGSTYDPWLGSLGNSASNNNSSPAGQSWN